MGDYIPLLVGAGLFVGSIFAGIWQGKKEKNADTDSKKQVVSTIMQDNYAVMMMSEQLRVNKEMMEKVVDAMRELVNSLENVRDEIKEARRDRRDQNK